MYKLLSFFLAFYFLGNTLQAQYIFKNNGFENWHYVPGSTTKEYPDNWSSDPLSLNDSNTYVAVSKTNDAHSGNWALRFAPRVPYITSSLVEDSHTLCYSLNPDKSSVQLFTYGDSISYLPGNFSAYYKFILTDSFTRVDAYINLYDSKTQQIVGGVIGHIHPSDTFRSLNFKIYKTAPISPDSFSLNLRFQSGSPNPTSYLIIDDMEFEGEYTSVNDVQLDKYITIYPNPATEYLYLKPSPTVSVNTFRIYTLGGQMIMDGKIENNKINIESLPPANYIIRFTTSAGNGNLRFVKQ